MRGIDKLLATPDEKLQAADKAYLERHQLDKLFGELLNNIIVQKPADPIQYIIDTCEFNADYAKQDPVTGLPEHRKAKLLDVFRVIDRDGHGKVSLKHLQDFTSRHGGTTLQPEELTSVLSDFHPGSDNLVTLPQFLIFFSKVSKTIPNAEFDRLVQDLMA